MQELRYLVLSGRCWMEACSSSGTPQFKIALGTLVSLEKVSLVPSWFVLDEQVKLVNFEGISLQECIALKRGDGQATFFLSSTKAESEAFSGLVDVCKPIQDVDDGGFCRFVLRRGLNVVRVLRGPR